MPQGKNIKYILYSLFENPLPNVTLTYFRESNFIYLYIVGGDTYYVLALLWSLQMGQKKGYDSYSSGVYCLMTERCMYTVVTV